LLLLLFVAEADGDPCNPDDGAVATSITGGGGSPQEGPRAVRVSLRRSAKSAKEARYSCGTNSSNSGYMWEEEEEEEGTAAVAAVEVALVGNSPHAFQSTLKVAKA
jgi:hypothetical protein